MADNDRVGPLKGGKLLNFLQAFDFEDLYCLE
jgi:hypothetical protein